MTTPGPTADDLAKALVAQRTRNASAPVATAIGDVTGDGLPDLIVANGGEIVQPIGVDAPEITARFRDPAGNLVEIFQPG